MRLHIVLISLLYATCGHAFLLGGTTPEIPPPADVVGGDIDKFRRVFVESLNFELSGDLPVDHLSGVTGPPIFTSETITPSESSPGIIPSGTKINSYYFFIDPIEEAPIFMTSDGWTILLEHDVPIESSLLGYIFLSSTLDSTDFLGSPTTTYPSGNAARGIEGGDSINSVLGGSGVTTVTISLDGGDVFDAVRIIELATPVPIPGTLYLLLSGIIGIGYSRRKMVLDQMPVSPCKSL